MIIRSALLVAGVGVAAFSAPPVARGQSAEPAAQPGGIAELEEIVVSARRRMESLQDVPQTVNVVTAAQIDRLNIRNLTDIQTLVPGLTLTGGGSFSTAATVRGVAFNVEASGNNPTVEFYLNDTPIASNFLFQSLFDLGQFELLRGPQGTLRGRASPSGSIALTTRKPDLGEWGGAANATVTDTHAYKYDAAVNIPIVKDILAVRLAGLSDENEWTRVETIKRSSDRAHNTDPYRRTEALRASVRFEPVDWFALDFMYQTLDQENASYDQVQSTSLLTGGAPSGTLIRPYDLLSPDDQGGRGRQDMDIYVLNADLRFAGQKLSYSGATSFQDFGSMGAGDDGDYFAAPRFASVERDFRDPANAEPVCQSEGRRSDLLPTNQEFYQCNHSRANRRSHELRLASEERVAGIFDYVIGAFADRNNAPVRLTQETPLLFSPTTIGAINLTAIVRDGESKENSMFGNVTAHLGDAFELSAGLRYIDYENTSTITVGGVSPTPDIDDQDTATVYTGSAKYRFNDDLMVYATVGTSWRPGVHVIGNFSVNLTPRELGFINLEPEESTSYETGLKALFFDRRVRFNLSLYRQDFDNYVYRGNSVYFVNYRRVTPTIVVPEVGGFNFVAAVPAQVDGIEAEAWWQITPRWSLGGNISYADGQIDDALVACTDLDGDGVSDVNAQPPTLTELRNAVGPGQNVSQCQFSGPASFTPKWSANLQSEADFALTQKMDGFVRALATYTPSNSQDPSNTFDNTDGYAMLNLFAGVRDPEGRWEVALFAKNIFDEQVVLNSGAASRSTNLTTLMFGPGGMPIGSANSQFTGPYSTVEVLAPREIGVSVRVGFGSH